MGNDYMKQFYYNQNLNWDDYGNYTTSTSQNEFRGSHFAVYDYIVCSTLTTTNKRFYANYTHFSYLLQNKTSLLNKTLCGTNNITIRNNGMDFPNITYYWDDTFNYLSNNYNFDFIGNDTLGYFRFYNFTDNNLLYLYALTEKIIFYDNKLIQVNTSNTQLNFTLNPLQELYSYNSTLFNTTKSWTNALFYYPNKSVNPSLSNTLNNDGFFNPESLINSEENMSYALDNFNCSESLQSTSGYPCGRENSPIVISGSGSSRTITSNITNTITIPIIIDSTNGYRACKDVKSVTLNGVSVPFTCNSPLTLSGSLIYGSNTLLLDYNVGGSSMCSGLLSGIDKTSGYLPKILLLIGFIVVMGIAGGLLYFYNGKTIDISGFSIQNATPWVIGIGLLIFVTVIVLVVASTMCSLNL
jgi:hypothetical protein